MANTVSQIRDSFVNTCRTHLAVNYVRPDMNSIIIALVDMYRIVNLIGSICGRINVPAV